MSCDKRVVWLYTRVCVNECVSDVSFAVVVDICLQFILCLLPWTDRLRATDLSSSLCIYFVYCSYINLFFFLFLLYVFKYRTLPNAEWHLNNRLNYKRGKFFLWANVVAAAATTPHLHRRHGRYSSCLRIFVDDIPRENVIIVVTFRNDIDCM